MAVVPAGHYSDDLHQSIIQGLAQLTTENMHWLLSNPQALDWVMEKLPLKERDEASVLYYILVQELVRRKEGDNGPRGCLSQEERMFLLSFPWRKHELEKTIKELRTIADEADSAHKMFTQTNLVASSVAAVSEAMTILGVALSPVTAGGSLLLSVAGQGLGAAAFVTNTVTNILEDRSKSSAREGASRLGALPIPEPEAGGGVSVSETTREAAQRCYEILKSIRTLHAYWKAQANPGFMQRVRNLVTTRRVPFLRAAGVQRAVAQGSGLAMTRGARVLSAAGAAFLLVQDVKSVLQDWQHLREGARSEVAADLRMQAEELEQELSQLCSHYEQIILRQDGS